MPAAMTMRRWESWADRIASWANGREHTSGTRVVDKPMRKLASGEVFVYFDNDKKPVGRALTHRQGCSAIEDVKC